MKQSPLLLSIFRHTWAIDPLYAFQIMPAIENLRSGKFELSDFGAQLPRELECVASEGKAVRYYSWKDAPAGSVAVIDLVGELMKSDQDCGPRGMETIGRRIQEANAKENIVAIILKTDTPGGTVDGTETLANIVKASKKPVLTFIDGLMASAGLWIGSSAKEIWASTEHDSVGSVGILMSFMDLQPYYEKMGVKFHNIDSSHSPDKNKLLDDVRKGIYDEVRKSRIDPVAEQFQKTVRANRSAVKDGHLTGKMYFAKDVLGVFVDRIGSFEEAVARAIELANEKEETDDNSIQINSNDMKAFNSLNKVLGVEQLESVDGVVSLNEDQLEAIEKVLSDAEAAQARLDEAEEKAQGTVSSVLKSLDEIHETVAKAEGYEAKVEAIRSILAERPSAAAKGAEGGDNTTNEDADWETIDSQPHNLGID